MLKIISEINVDLDLANLLQPEVQPPANGSSRSHGGFSRGRALGNVHNFGDPGSSNMEEVESFIPDGHVNLSIVNQPPRTLSVDETSSVIKLMAPCHQLMGPLLKHVSHAYSPIRSILFYLMQRLLLTKLI